MKKNQPLSDLENTIKVSKKICLHAIDMWLKDQDLHLSNTQKNKLALLLIRYFGEKEGLSEEQILNLLGNLGGGYFDFDNLDDVEIEIQRLLGHTKPLDQENLSLFMRKSAVSGLVILFLVAIGIAFIAFDHMTENSQATTSQYALLSESQSHELDVLLEDIQTLQKDMGRPAGDYSRDKALRLLVEPLGISDPDQITQDHYLSLKHLMTNIRDELKKQKGQ